MSSRRAIEDLEDAFSLFRMMSKMGGVLFSRILVMVGLFADPVAFEEMARYMSTLMRPKQLLIPLPRRYNLRSPVSLLHA